MRIEETAADPGWVATADITCSDALLKAAFDPSGQQSIEAGLARGRLNLSDIRDLAGIPDDEFPTGVVEKFDVSFSGDFNAPITWNCSLNFLSKSLGMRGFQFEEIVCRANVVDGAVRIPALEVISGRTRVAASAEADIGNFGELSDVEVESLGVAGSAMVDSDDLGELLESSGGNLDFQLSGSVDANLTWEIKGGRLEKLVGPVKANRLRVASTKIESIDLLCDSTQPDRIEASGSVQFDAKNVVQLEGDYEIRTGDYHATVDLQAGDLGGLRACLVEVSPEAKPLTGSTTASVRAVGNSLNGSYTVSGNLVGSEVVVGTADPVAVAGRFSHSSDATAVNDVRVQTGDLRLVLDASLLGGKLTVPTVAFSDGDEELIVGNLSVPCDQAQAKSAHEFLSQPGLVDGNLSIKPTSIADLCRIAGRESAGVAGSVEGMIKMNGTLGDPILDGTLNFNGISIEGEGQMIAPADASIQFGVLEHRLRVNGRVIQPEIEPISIVGETPFFPREWTDPDAAFLLSDGPLDLAVQLPPTSLGKLEEWVPAISAVDGNIAADVKVEGTIGSPAISGDFRVALPKLKFHRAELPDVKDTACHVQFVENQIIVKTFRGTAAGGTFTGSGSVNIAEVSDPVMDLSLLAEEALFYRTEDLSVRSNLSIELDGPVSAAQVRADVALVNSRYQKEIDLLPIAMPERGPKIPSVSGPRAARNAPKVGIEAEPVANWDFDVHFTTQDPFLVIGNLATSEVLADMRITGKGHQLKPSGEISLENAKATLPFSTLVIDLATLSFLSELGFDPKLSVDGTAEVDNYQLRIHAYNTALNPECIMTSNPPLPEEDIISLIVTGATREQLETSGQGQAMAKGGKLLLEKMRQDMGLSSAEKMLIPRNLTFDIGGVNQRTGEPTATAKLKLRKRIFVLGNVDTEGQYRGVLKWAIRFR